MGKRKLVFSFLLSSLLLSCSQMAVVSPELLRVAVPRNLSAVLMLIAQRENYFADLGLRVVIVPKETSEAAYKELVQGKVQLAVTDTTAMAFGDNPDVRILSEVFSSSRGMYLVVPDRKVKTLANLQNMPIRIERKSSEEWFVNLLSIAEGLNLDKNPLVSDSVRGQAKKAKKEAQVASSVEVAKLQAKTIDEDFNIFSSRVHIEISFVSSLGDQRDDKTNKVDRFLMSLSRAEERFYRDPAVAKRVLLEFIPELKRQNLDSLLTGSLFRLGLTNSLFVLLQEQDKWVRTRYQKRGEKGGLDIRRAMVPDYLRAVKAGSVTLTEDHMGAP